MIRGINLLLLIIVLFGCNNQSKTESEVQILENCLGVLKTELFNEIILSFDSFLIENGFCTNSSNINSGIVKFVEDIKDQELQPWSLKHDSMSSEKIVSSIFKLGFLNSNHPDIYYDSINGSLHLKNSVWKFDPLFNLYDQYLPCLNNAIKDTTSFPYYYLIQKKEQGDLALNLFAWEVFSMVPNEDYNLKIIKEIIIIEFYVDLLIASTRE